MGTVKEKKKIEWKPGSFSNNPVYDELGRKLLSLAGYWRMTKDPNYARKYQAILLALIELGWDEGLEVQAELPDELMPPEYFDL